MRNPKMPIGESKSNKTETVDGTAVEQTLLETVIA